MAKLGNLGNLPAENIRRDPYIDPSSRRDLLINLLKSFPHSDDDLSAEAKAGRLEAHAIDAGYPLSARELPRASQVPE